mmetsp:Transcript_17825/g.37261  ORF Transcript_17825/g.37261 Transcript_17825/m.37261 type:complete len:384 (+) Transcript_17825:79-1230(+)
MGTSLLTTLTVGAIATTAATAILIRRRISRKWLSLPPASTTAISTSTSNTSSFRNYNFKALTKNHVIVITGGNTGLGYQTALDLASRGGNIILACRNVQAGEVAARNIARDTGNEYVSCRELDLASLSSVREFASKLENEFVKSKAIKDDRKDVSDDNTEAKGKGLYALICNAGVWMPMDKRAKTSNGYEIHFGVNHLGHFLLIQEMIPLLRSSGMASRVVIVSSSLLKSGQIDMKSKDFVKDGRAIPAVKKKGFAPTGYCDSKLMNMLTCRQLALHLRDTNVTTYSVSPGFCRSELGRNVEMPIFKKMLMLPIMRMVQRTSVQGAQNIIFATILDENYMVNGAMYQDGRVAEPETLYVDGLGDDLGKELWKLSLDLVDEKKQ